MQRPNVARREVPCKRQASSGRDQAGLASTAADLRWPLKVFAPVLVCVGWWRLARSVQSELEHREAEAQVLRTRAEAARILEHEAAAARTMVHELQSELTQVTPAYR
jgi:hypothetical protein